MHDYLDGSRIANVRSAYGIPGTLGTIYPETFGGAGHSQRTQASIVWHKSHTHYLN